MLYALEILTIFKPLRAHDPDSELTEVPGEDIVQHARLIGGQGEIHDSQHGSRYLDRVKAGKRVRLESNRRQVRSGHHCFCRW